MPSPIDPPNPAAGRTSISTSAARVPLGLSGRLVGDRPRRRRPLVSLRQRPGRRTSAHDVGTAAAVEDLVAFEGSILVYGDDSPRCVS